MTLVELLEACHRKVMTLEPYEWQCFGNQAGLLTMGTPDLHQASAVIDQENLRVYALEIPLRAQWVDPDYLDAYQQELRAQGIADSTPSIAQDQILKLLAEITE